MFIHSFKIFVIGGLLHLTACAAYSGQESFVGTDAVGGDPVYNYIYRSTSPTAVPGRPGVTNNQEFRMLSKGTL